MIPDSSRRRRRRAKREEFINFVVAVLNFLYLGLPKGRAHLAFPRELSASQEDAVARITKEAEKFCAGSGGSIASTGRGRQRLYELILAASPRDYSRVLADRTNRDAVSVAQAVEPDMISLPKVAGSLRLVDVLPPERAKVARDHCATMPQDHTR